MLTSSDLASKIAPAISAALEARKVAIIAAQPGGLARLGVRALWPHIMAEVPNLSAVAVDAVRAEFGTMNLNDALDWLANRP